MSAPPAHTASNGANKRPREFAYQEPNGPPIPQQNNNSTVMPNYMGYYPQGVPGVQQVPLPPQMYQQMPGTSDTPMSLPPLYVGPAMGLAVSGGQVINNSSSNEQAAEPTSSKKKHTSQWALEKRRARNRVTAAESRRKSKAEAALLKEEVQRLDTDLKTKNDLLQDFKDKLQMFESGKSKAEIDQFISQRRAAAAAAAAVQPPPQIEVSSVMSGLVAVSQQSNTHSGIVHSAPGQVAEL